MRDIGKYNLKIPIHELNFRSGRVKTNWSFPKVGECIESEWRQIVANDGLLSSIDKFKQTIWLQAELGGTATPPVSWSQISDLSSTVLLRNLACSELEILVVSKLTLAWVIFLFH